jgi:mannose/fructose/N-acetylgalactosamine-specific phosphotransferase system component IID
VGTLIEERIMNTKISTKLAALAAALAMNGLIVGGVAHMFYVPLKLHAALSHAALSAGHTAGIADSGRRRQCACTRHGEDNCQCVATSQL